ncbi:MAG TPA: hypothetical protein VGJ26_16210 [Pirellulales bacterium]|jgi:hypothetical protein
MATNVTTEGPVSTAKRTASAAALRVSAYDRVASLLVSLLMLIGCLVVFLFIAWLSTRVYKVEKAVPVELVEVAGGGYENGVGTDGMQIDSPTESEIAGDSDMVETKPADTLTALVDSAVVPTTELDMLDEKLDRQEKWVGHGKSEGIGNKGPAKGTGGGWGGGANRAQRWEIRMPEGNSVDTYAKQLDAFGIEIGILAENSEFMFLSKLSAKVPTKRNGPRAGEKRRMLIWNRGDLKQADIDLFKRAGVDVGNRTTIWFIPVATDSKLAQLEVGFKNRAVKDIRRTRFGIKPGAGSFEFYVIDQTYF